VIDAQSLAQVSNACVYSAMLALTVAMFGFAVSFAQRRTSVIDLREPVLATVGGDPSGDGRPRTPDLSQEPSVVAAPDEAEPGRRAGNIALAVSWLAFGFLLAGVVTRGLWAGRVPWGNMYEFSIMSALGLLGVFLAVSTRRDIRWLGLFLIPLVLLTLGLAVTVLYTEAAQLVPALHSYWLLIHVSTAIVCGGAFTFAGVVAGLYLVADTGADGSTSRAARWCRPLAARLPAAPKLDRLSYRAIAFTFPLWTFAIVAGAIWAESAWGRYWGWDPKETWAFITWVAYAGYLHARSTVGWRGRKAAWLAVAGTGIFWFNYFGVNLLFSGLHSYSGM
jgi:cytochrome c-type biogenesis protein CcsB